MPRLAVTGANGFVGRHVVAAARDQGWEVAGLVRTDVGARQVREAGGVPVGIEGLGSEPLADALAGAEAVVHLAQIGTERGTATYRDVNVEGTRHVVAAAMRAGVARLVFLSGLGVAHFGMRPRTTNEYFRSKVLAEAVLFESGLGVTVFRPSYVVGPGDGLISSLLADMATGEVQRPGDGTYRLQPIAVTDAAAAILSALRTVKPGRMPRVLDLVGPAPISYRAFLELTLRVAREEGRASQVAVREVPIAEADRQAAAGGYKGMLPDELDCLLCDEVSDAGPLEALLGRPLKDLQDAIRRAVRGMPG